MKAFELWQKEALGSDRVFIIAEMSANHNGDFEIAKETIRAAKRAGADAIKLQTYRADTVTLDVKTEAFTVSGGTLWDGKTFYELYQEACTPWEWHADLFRIAREEGLICFSSPFDKTAVDLLESLNCPLYKIASLEITDIPLIEYVASMGKPILFSTGVAGGKDIDLALDTCRNLGNDRIALLKCTASYPAEIKDANLIMIKDMATRYDVVSGLSDHTPGIELPMLSVVSGGKVIEKHFILNKQVGGPDSAFSLDEKEFSEMVDGVRKAERAIGSISYDLTDKQKETREFCRSLYICEDVKKGQEVTAGNIRSVRPGYGLHPQYFEEVLGRKFSKDFCKGTPLSLEKCK